jgi:hypothetical protein
VRRVELLAQRFIQRIHQTAGAAPEAVNGDIFHAVRYPDIHYRWRAQLLAKVRGYAAAGFQWSIQNWRISSFA